MAPPIRRTDAERSVKFKVLYDFIIDLTLGTKGVIDEGTAVELYPDIDGGTKGKIARTLLKERITYEDVVNMVYDWASQLDSETRGWSYSPTELMIKRARISDPEGGFFEVRVRKSDSIEASIDAILSNAFVNPTLEDISKGWDKWHWQGFGLVDGILESDDNQDPIIEAFTNRKELDLTTYFIDKGVNAYLSTDSQMGQFINQVSPILFPSDPSALARHLYQDGAAWQNLANSWPEILAAVKLEETANVTPNLRRGLGKIIEQIVDPDSEYGWIASIFGPSEMLPDTPKEFINKDEWVSYRARANATFKNNKSIIDDPLSVLRSFLPGDNELKELYGSWAVTSKKSFLEYWEGHVENIAESLGIGIDPETGDYTRAAGMMHDRITAIWQNEETGWIAHLGKSERLHYQDATVRKNMINELLDKHGYAPDRISDDMRFQLSQRLAMMGDVELFKRTYSKEIIDQYVQIHEYNEYKEEFGSWELVEDVVDAWLMESGDLEVPDARKREMIQWLYEQIPNLEEFTGSPQDEATLMDKLEVEFGAAKFGFSAEKTRAEALEEFDTTTYTDAKNVVEAFLGLGVEISDFEKNKMIEAVQNTWQLAKLDPSLPIPNNNEILQPWLDRLPELQYKKRNQDLVESTTAITGSIQDVLGMDEAMLKRTPGVYSALDTGARLTLEGLIRKAYEEDPSLAKTPEQLTNEFMLTMGITPSGDIGEYPSVWTAGGEEIAYEPPAALTPSFLPTPPIEPISIGELVPSWIPDPMAGVYGPVGFVPQFDELKWEALPPDYVPPLEGLVPAPPPPPSISPPLTKEELNEDYVRRLEEAGLPQAIIDFETRRITDEYQKAMVQEQLQSGRPPRIPQEFMEYARDYGTETIPAYDFLGDIGVQATNARAEATALREAIAADPIGNARLRLTLESQERVADRLEALVAQQVGDPSYPHLTDADFPTRENLLGGIRDEFSGSAAGREFIERQIADENIDFSTIDAQIGAISGGEGLRHPQTMPADPMALIPSFTQQQLPTLRQDFAQEQQEEQVRRGELTGTGSTIFRRRTL